jgi:hypothetical protein
MWLSGAFQMINVANTVDDETKHPQHLASTFRALISAGEWCWSFCAK